MMRTASPWILCLGLLLAAPLPAQDDATGSNQKRPAGEKMRQADADADAANDNDNDNDNDAAQRAVAAEENSAGSASTSSRPFIEESLVLAPEQVGKFTLAHLNDFPGNPPAGVAVRYQHADFPAVRVDVFVYPVGRTDRDDILAWGLEQVRADLGQAVDKGSYAELEIGAVKDFDLRRVDTDGSLLPEGSGPAPAADPAATAAGITTDRDRAVVAAITDAQDRLDPRVGRLMEIRLQINGEPLNSRAFLFYRGLFLYKGRISATAIDLPDEAFERFTNHAMATLVPVIEVRSTGDCHQHTIYMDEKNESDEGLARFAADLAKSNLRGEQENCAQTLDTTVPEGFQAKGLLFDPAMWKGGG